MIIENNTEEWLARIDDSLLDIINLLKEILVELQRLNSK